MPNISSNEKFEISISNNFGNKNQTTNIKNEKVTPVLTVFLQTLDNSTLYDMAFTLFNDCFDFDPYGNHLFEATIWVHTRIRGKSYRFKIDQSDVNSIESILFAISKQLIL